MQDFLITTGIEHAQVLARRLLSVDISFSIPEKKLYRRANSLFIRLCCLVFCALTLQIKAAHASPTFTNWRLSCGVQIDGYPIGGATTNGVVFPLDLQQSGSAHNSSVSCSYQGTFDNSNLDFLASASLTCEGIPSPGFAMTSASGIATFTTTIPLLISVDASFSYALGGGDRQCEFSVAVLEVGGPFLYVYNNGAQPIFGDPRVGTFTAHADPFVLEANKTYTFGYGYFLKSFGGNPSVLSTGTGSAHFEIHPIPEPATLALLALAAPLFKRRRR